MPPLNKFAKNGAGDGFSLGTPILPKPPRLELADIILARHLFAFGEQDDYFDNKDCIGWVRRGTSDRPWGLACVMTNNGPAENQMCVGAEHRGETWVDLLGWEENEVKIDEDGNGLFPCPQTSVSIFVNQEAQERDRFPVNFDADIDRE